MRIECTHGCDQVFDVPIPPHPAIFVTTGQLTLPTAAELLAEIRAEADRQLGHAITEAIVAHVLLDCPATKAADADCGATSPMGYTCNLQTGHSGDMHEHQVDERDPDSDPADPQAPTITRVVASWPKLQTVQ